MRDRGGLVELPANRRLAVRLHLQGLTTAEIGEPAGGASPRPGIWSTAVSRISDSICVHLESRTGDDGERRRRPRNLPGQIS